MENKYWIELPQSSQEKLKKGWIGIDRASEEVLGRRAIEVLGIEGSRVDLEHNRRWFKPAGPFAYKCVSPTREDGDNKGLILAINPTTNDTRRQEWPLMAPPGFTHWMPLNFRGATPNTEITVEGQKLQVIPQRDGSLKIGCSTVTNEQMEAIIKHREEVVKNGK